MSKVSFNKESEVKEVGMVFSEAMEKVESISTNENNHAALDRVADISCTSSDVSKVKKCLNDIVGNSTRGSFDLILDNYKILLDTVFNGSEEMFYYASLAIVEAANVRDPREGRGERDHFYSRFAMIYEKDKHVAAVLLNHIIKTHGSFLDLKKMWDVNFWQVNLTLAEDYQSLIAVCVANSIHKDIIAFREWEKLKASMDPSEEGISSEEKDKRNVLHKCPPECSLATKWIPKIHGTCRNDEQAKYSKIKNKLEYRVAIELGKLGLVPSIDFTNEKSLHKAVNKMMASTRKIVSLLNMHIKTTEVFLCSNSLEKIDPKFVPAGANHLYKLKFLNLKSDRRTERSEDQSARDLRERFLEAAQKSVDTGKGLKGSNVGALKLFQNYYYDSCFDKFSFSIPEMPPEELLFNEGMFANLITELKDSIENTKKKVLDGEIDQEDSFTFGRSITMVDTSGSMSGTPIVAAMALGIVCSMLQLGGFKNKILTFSAEPRMITLPEGREGKVLFDKVRKIQELTQNQYWGGNTDFKKALLLILETAVSHKVPQDEMPQNLFVFSDMQIDEASYFPKRRITREDGENYIARAMETMLDGIKIDYQEHGYEPPRIVFWNLRATNTSPCGAFCKGASCMSGYSDKMLKAFFDGTITAGKEVNPWETTEEILMSPKFENLRKDAILAVGRDKDSDNFINWPWGVGDSRGNLISSKSTESSDLQDDGEKLPPEPFVVKQDEDGNWNAKIVRMDSVEQLAEMNKSVMPPVPPEDP